jgi:S-(hydroxymethyl)glutathione dehydrogenase/alcohol dehydrogenase
MRAALLEVHRKPLVIATDVDVASPGPDEVVVRIANCGICHSDLTLVEMPGGTPLPIVLGHEAAGVVEEVGGAVRQLRRGDSVVLTPLAPCGHCYFCVRAQPTLCVEAQGFMSGTRADGTSPLSRKGELVYRGFSTGGFGEYALVHQNAAVKVPAETPLEIACVIGCAVQTGVGAVLNTARVEEGATVLVTGLGGIGVSIVQGARLAGAATIIASDPVAERRDHAKHFGATHVLDPTQDDVVARARELTGGIGVDYAFDGAGSHELIQHCLSASRIGGTTVMVGAPIDPRPLEIPIPALFLTWEKKLVGSLLGSCHSHRDVPRLLALWRKGALDLEGMISQRRPIEDINLGLDDLRASRGIRTVLSF